MIVVPTSAPAVTGKALSKLITPMPTSGVRIAKIIELNYDTPN